MIPDISIKVQTPAVLEHQNESEQIVTPVRSQTGTLYSNQTVLFPESGSFANSDQFAVVHNIPCIDNITWSNQEQHIY